jgi:hypothetical protein
MPSARLHSVIISALTASTLIAAPAHAAQEAVSSGSTITVIGTPLTKAELRTKSEAFVRTATVLPDEGQFARRFDPICPSVSGIDVQLAKRVATKIRDVARTAGIAVAGANCRTNILINFTDNVDAFFTQSRKTRPGLFSAMRPFEKTALFESKAPIRWFYATETLSGDRGSLERTAGNTPMSVGTGGQSSGEGGPSSSGVGGTDGPSSNRGSLKVTSSTLIGSNIVVNLASAVIVIDVNAASGSALDSVAAYAAMVSLAQIKLTGAYGAYPSILAMYDNGKAREEAPRDLTEWDYAYLRALYTAPPNRLARVQRPKILGSMVKDLTK